MTLTSNSGMVKVTPPNPFELFLVACNAISVPIYIFFVIVVLRNRKKEPFNSSFFGLCMSLALIDIPQIIRRYFNRSVTWGLGYIYVRYLPMWLVYLLFNLDLIFLWYNQQSQNINAMWLALNRFTALAFPTRYERIWSRKTTALAIFLQLLLPAFFVSPMLFHGFPYFVDIDNRTGDVAETPYDPRLPDLLSLMASYLIRVVLFVAGISYALSIRSIWKFYRQTKTIETAAKRRSGAREAGFTLVSLTTFMLLCLYYLRMISQSNGWSNIYYQIGTYAGDIRSFINPYTIFLVSKAVRDATRNQLAVFFPRLLKNSASSTIAQNAQTAMHANSGIIVTAVNNTMTISKNNQPSLNGVTAWRSNRPNGNAWA